MIDYKKVINDRHKNKIQIKFELWKFLTILFFTLLINCILIYISYNWWIYTDYSFLNKINNYLHWIFFFNYILILISILNIFFAIKDSFIVKKFYWERKRYFNEDWTMIIHNK